MAKHHVYLHIGPDVIEIDAEARERLAAAGLRTPDVTQEDLRRADLEIRRVHKAAGLRRKEVEGAWSQVCRKLFRAKTDAFVSVPGFFDADDDQAALALDTLAGLKVHLVVTTLVDAELPDAWRRRVKAHRIHAMAPDLSPSTFAAELAQTALREEKSRLDKSLLKIKKRRKSIKDQLAA